MAMESNPVELGRQLIIEQQFLEAELHFQRLMFEDEFCLDALLWLGRINLLQETPEIGLECFREALRLAPENAEAITLEAICQIQLGRYVRALHALQHARELDPNLPLIYLPLSFCYREFRRFSEAEEALQMAISLEPDNDQAHYELSYVLSLRGFFMSAMRSLRKTLQLNPNHLMAYMTIGEVYKRAGRVPQLFDTMDERINCSSNLPLLQQSFSKLYRSKGPVFRLCPS